MIMAGWAILGIAVGAVATEVIRACKPVLVKKVEEAAQRFVDSFCPQRPAGDEAAEEAVDISAAED